jgi:hypothetical protein
MRNLAFLGFIIRGSERANASEMIIYAQLLTHLLWQFTKRLRVAFNNTIS